MKTKTKRLLIVLAVVFTMLCGATVWTAIQVVSWARDIPNRIIIDEEAMADAFGAFFLEACREGLVNGDSDTQRQIIRDLTTLAAQDPAARESVLAEFSDELQQLTESSDTDVADEASSLLELLRSEDVSGDSD